MTMMEWAENEVRIACKRERGDKPEGEWDYGCACYESALKAYKCLMEDGHSGMSFSVTKQILNRLLDEQPLTPIEDIPENWIEHPFSNGDPKEYQCVRKFSLFKYVYPDGSVKYHDVERARGKDTISGWGPYSSGLITRIVDEYFPIRFPYVPECKPYIVNTAEYLTDRKNGDYDTIEIVSIKQPNGELLDIHRYFKDGENDMEEINLTEFWKQKPV